MTDAFHVATGEPRLLAVSPQGCVHSVLQVLQGFCTCSGHKLWQLV